MAAVFGTYPLLMLMTLILTNVEAQSMPTSQDIVQKNESICAANLTRLYKMLKRYAHHSGETAFPRTLGSLFLMVRDPAPFVCPGDTSPDPPDAPDAPPTSYRLVNDPFSPSLKGVPPGRLAIVIETRAGEDGHRLVLFWDGSIKNLDTAQFETLTKDSFVVQQ
jgi:hypothetical protein